MHRVEVVLEVEFSSRGDMPGAPGLAFETWDFTRKGGRQYAPTSAVILGEVEGPARATLVRIGLA